MRIYPAIDIKGGNCVRLSQGKFDKVTVYGDDPAAVAKQWEKCGAEFIHIVDLDGAQQGRDINGEAIRQICTSVQIPVQVGGGIRTAEDVKKRLSWGINRVILGTVAVTRPELVREMVLQFGAAVAVGIDARDGLVATHGWERSSELDAVAFAQDMCRLGVATIIYTDIATDGMLAGPNLEAMQQMVGSVSANVIASGGVGCLDDICALKKTGVEGAIVGKALYAGKVDLREAIQAAK